MAHAFLQLALGEQSFAQTHLVHVRLNLFYELLHALGASHWVFGVHLAQLVASEAHVVEVGDCLAQLVGDVGQSSLEVAKRLACVVRRFGCHGVHRHGVADEYRHAPVALAVEVVGLSVGGGHEAQHAAVDVVGSFCLQLLAYVVGHGLHVVLQQVNIGEDVVVDALQDVVGAVVFCGLYAVCVVDESVAERLDVADGAFDEKLAGNVV